MYDRWEFEHKGKSFHVQVKGSLIVNDLVKMNSAALNGAGIAYTTEDSIRDDVTAGKNGNSS